VKHALEDGGSVFDYSTWVEYGRSDGICYYLANPDPRIEAETHFPNRSEKHRISESIRKYMDRVKETGEEGDRIGFVWNILDIFSLHRNGREGQEFLTANTAIDIALCLMESRVPPAEQISWFTKLFPFGMVCYDTNPNHPCFLIAVASSFLYRSSTIYKSPESIDFLKDFSNPLSDDELNQVRVLTKGSKPTRSLGYMHVDQLKCDKIDPEYAELSDEFFEEHGINVLVRIVSDRDKKEEERFREKLVNLANVEEGSLSTFVYHENLSDLLDDSKWIMYHTMDLGYKRFIYFYRLQPSHIVQEVVSASISAEEEREKTT